MNRDRARTLLLTLPHATETLQWGETLVFWVGDKRIGGRMFALIALDTADGDGRPMLSFAAGAERYPTLLEREGVIPAPYLARAFWVAATQRDAFSAAEWTANFAAAHAFVLGRLPARTRAVLAMPAADRRRLLKAQAAAPR